MTVQRSERTSKQVVRYVLDDYVNHVACLASDVLEPRSESEAITSPQSEQWRYAANEE